MRWTAQWFRLRGTGTFGRTRGDPRPLAWAPTGSHARRDPRKATMRARDIMTRSVLSVQPSVPVAKAATMLAKRGFTALPVTNDAGELIGIVTEADLIGNRFPVSEEAAEAAAAHGPAATVGEVMTTPVVGVSHDTDVSVVAREMLTDKRRSLPIVDGTVLVGVVTRRDIVRALARTDEEIAADIRSKLGVIGGLSRWS